MRAARRPVVRGIPDFSRASMLHRARPTTRLILAVLLIAWLLLQVLLLLLGHEPAMRDLGRAITILVALAVPISVWLLKTHFPEADVPPRKLETLFMVAAFGFATTILLRSVMKSSPALAAGNAAG
jgi:hypothetical protein